MENLRAYVIAIALAAGVTGCGSSSDGSPVCSHAPELLFEETMACTGLWAPYPIVLFESFPGPYGQYSAGPGVVRINASPVWAGAMCDDTKRTLRHEFIHHLLWVNYGDLTHDSDFFRRCT